MDNLEKYLCTLKKYWADNKHESPDGKNFLLKKREVLQLKEDETLPKERELLEKFENALKIAFDLGLDKEITEFSKGEFIELCNDLSFSSEDTEIILKRLSQTHSLHAKSGEKESATKESTSNKSLGKPITEANSVIELKFLGFPFKISKGALEYAKIYKRFFNFADYQEEKYKQTFRNYTSLDMFMEKGFQDGLNFILAAAPLVRECFVAHNLYEVDLDKFFKDFFKDFHSWEESFEKVADQYHQIILDEEHLEKYRAARSEARGRWIGGGFGLGGAVKGVAAAGVMNMATGAAHMIFSGIGSILSSIDANAKKSKILADEKTIESLSKAIVVTIQILCFETIAKINKHFGKIIVEEFYDFKRVEKAMAILKNLKELKSIDPILEKELLFKAFTYDPYLTGGYKYVFEKYGDPEGELHTMAEFFGINVQPTKDRILRELVEKVSLKSKKEVAKLITLLNEKEKQLGFKEKSSCLKELETLVLKNDQNERTVGGVLLQSSDEANSYRQSVIAQIKSFWGNLKESHVYFYPNIPEQKLENALEFYIAKQDNTIQIGDIMLLYDNTALGSADEGFCLTPSKIFWKNGFTEIGTVEYVKITQISLDKGWLATDLFVNDFKIHLNMADDKTQTFPKLVGLLEQLKSKNWAKPLTKTTQLQIASPQVELPPQTKAHCENNYADNQPSVEKERLLELIKKTIQGNTKNCIFISPNLPIKKIKGVMDGYVTNLDKGRKTDDLRFIYDNTAFGSADEGFCLFQDAVFWRYMSQRGLLLFKDIKKVKLDAGWTSSDLILNESKIRIIIGQSLAPSFELLMKKIVSMTAGG